MARDNALNEPTTTRPARPSGLVRDLGPLDATMIVAGSMIGSGVFIVSADIARQVGSPGLLLATWVITGILTVLAALSYGELAAMMPEAGGQYVYLREAWSPLWGFLYGWTFFLVIQTGTIAAVGVGFARFLGVLVPAISPSEWIIPPVDLGSHYALSLSTQQLVAIAMIVLLTWINTRGIHVGKLIQNVFTSAKTLSLLLLIALGILVGRNAGALSANFSDFWAVNEAAPIASSYIGALPVVTASGGLFGLIVAMGVAQVGSLFSSDAWNNVTFTAGEVKNPRRDVPMSLALGTLLVTVLYVLANVAYLCTLPLNAIQTAPDDRVGTASLNAVFGGAGATVMAVAILISTFGCNNGLIFAGARVYYAMARDGLFFRSTGRLNRFNVPAMGLVLQAIWTCLLVLPRTRSVDAATGQVRYGNLYSSLLDYVVFAVLIFYVLTVAGVFVLRRTRPDAPRPYRAIGYPILPAAYIAGALLILAILLLYKTETSWPGLLIVLTGVPVYHLWRRRAVTPL